MWRKFSQEVPIFDVGAIMAMAYPHMPFGSDGISSLFCRFS